MRMQLYEITIKFERNGKVVTGHIVAPTEPIAADLAYEHEDMLFGEENVTFTLERVDETLPHDRRLGLDDLLERAPQCFASYVDDIGWTVHDGASQRLRLFRIEVEAGVRVYVIAPNSNTASALYFTGNPVEDGEHRLFQICDGLADLPTDRIANIMHLLKLGQAGIATFDKQNGWSVNR